MVGMDVTTREEEQQRTKKEPEALRLAASEKRLQEAQRAEKHVQQCSWIALRLRGPKARVARRRCL